MRLGEAVAAERGELRRDFQDHPAVVPARHRALHEALQLLIDQLLDLLADRLAEHVGFRERVAGEHVGDPHHLLLIGDDAVGRREDLLELGERVADLVPAQLAVDVHEVHPGVERAGAEQGVRRDEVDERVALHVAEAVGGERGLELEDARGAPRAQQPVDVGVLEVERRRVEGDSVALPDHLDRVVDDGQGLEAEQVDLEHADVLERDHVVLRDDGVRALGREADGDVIGQRAGSDHQSGRVHRGVPRQPLDARAQLQHLADPLVLGGRGLHLRHLLGRLRQGQRVRRTRGDELRDPVHVAHLDAQRTGDVAERGAGFESPEGDDLAHRFPAVPRPHVLDHFPAALEAKIEVDVRHRDALEVQEPLEQQIELEWVDVGDAQGVGDERARRRAAPRTRGDPAIARRLDQVVHDEEVAGVPGALDHVQLGGEALLHGGGEGRAVARRGAGTGQVHEQIVVVREFRRSRVLRQEVPLLEVELASLGDALRLRDRVGMLREQRAHLRLRLDVALAAHEPEPLRVVEVLAGADRQQHVVRLGILAQQVVRVVGRRDRDAQLRGEPEHPRGDDRFVRDAVVLHFEPEPVGPEGAGEPLGAHLGRLVVSLAEVERDLSREACREADQPVLVLLQDFLVDARPAVISLEKADGGELDEVLVPRAVTGEKHEVRVRRRRVHGPLPQLPAAERQVGFEPQDRPDLSRLGLLVEGPGAVQVPVVGDGERVHAERLDAVQQVRDPIGAVEERVLAVSMEVGEGHGLPRILPGPWRVVKSRDAAEICAPCVGSRASLPWP